MRRRTLALGSVALLAAFIGNPADAAEPALPQGFSDEAMFDVANPTALAFTPDGRLLLSSQAGRLYVIQNGVPLGGPALDLSNDVCSNRERGLLGLTVDPGFASNGYIYTYYTFRKHPCRNVNRQKVPVNRVTRFTMAPDSTVDPLSQKVIMDGIPSPYGWHDGGDLGFGANGLLYVSTGDGSCQIDNPTRCQSLNNNSRRLRLPLGKILRVTPNGGVPEGNPFADDEKARRCAGPRGPRPGTGPCKEVFASGLRNPFRFAFEPGTNRFFINDVGANAWEEVNRSRRGGDYGWNLREGPCKVGSYTTCPPPPKGMVDPYYAYRQSVTGCRAITGGAFVPQGVWPDEYQGDYLFADFICGKIFRLERDASGALSRVSPFATNLSLPSAIDLMFGPHQGGTSLYYTTYADGGQLRRIDYTADVDPPIVNGR